MTKKYCVCNPRQKIEMGGACNTYCGQLYTGFLEANPKGK